MKTWPACNDNPESSCSRWPSSSATADARLVGVASARLKTTPFPTAPACRRRFKACARKAERDQGDYSEEPSHQHRSIGVCSSDLIVLVVLRVASSFWDCRVTAGFLLKFEHFSWLLCVSTPASLLLGDGNALDRAKRCADCVNYRHHRAADFPGDDSSRKKGDQRHHHRKQDARQRHQQSSGRPLEPSPQTVCGQHGAQALSIDGRQKHTEQGVHDAPGVEYEHVYQVAACQLTDTERRVECKHHRPDRVQYRPVQTVQNCEDEQRDREDDGGGR